MEYWNVLGYSRPQKGCTSKNTVDFGRRESSISYYNLLGCTVIYKGVMYQDIRTRIQLGTGLGQCLFFFGRTFDLVSGRYTNCACAD